MRIDSSNAMLSSYSWNTSGFILCLSLIPLIIANLLVYEIINTKLKILYFIPSVICLILVISYLFISFTKKEEEYISITINGMKCELKGTVYHYKINEEIDGTYSLTIDENDKIPVDIINCN